MKRIGVGVATVVALCILGSLTNFQDVSLWVILVTLPITLLFIVAYVPERPWRHWFGTSLLLLAIGVVAVGLAGVLFRIYGLDYPFRELLGMTWVGLMYVSMVMRTWVLLASQAKDDFGVGGWIQRTYRRSRP